MAKSKALAFIQCGRRVSADEIEQIKETVKLSEKRKVGMTTGEGLVRPGKSYSTTPKKLFVKPLSEQFREILYSENLRGRVEE